MDSLATELLEAARVAVLAYFSHHGTETHWVCPTMGRFCGVPADMERLAKAVDAHDAIEEWEEPCPHFSWTGDEGPVALLGRSPRRWRCDSCSLVKEDPPLTEREAG